MRPTLLERQDAHAKKKAVANCTDAKMVVEETELNESQMEDMLLANSSATGMLSLYRDSRNNSTAKIK